MLRLLCILIALTTMLSCDKKEVLLPPPTPEPELAIANNAPNAFSVVLKHVSDSSARVQWEKPVDIDGDSIRYTVRLNGQLIDSAIVATAYNFEKRLLPLTPNQVDIYAYDRHKAFSKASVNFTTTSLTFCKVYEDGTAAEGLILSQNGFILYGTYARESYSYSPFLTEVTPIGHPLWFKELMHQPADNNTISSVYKMGAGYAIGRQENETLAAKTQYARFDILDNFGNTKSTFRELFGNPVHNNFILSADETICGIYSGLNKAGTQYELSFYQIANDGSVSSKKTIAQKAPITAFCPDLDGTAYVATRHSENRWNGSVMRLNKDGILWEKPFNLDRAFGCADIKVLDDGIICLGTTHRLPFQVIGMLLRMDFSGNIVWQKIIETGGWVYPQKLQLTPDGGYMLLIDNNHQYSQDVMLLKLNSELEMEWYRAINVIEGFHLNTATELLLAPHGGYYVLGTTRHFYNTYQHNMFLIQTDSEGNWQ